LGLIEEERKRFNF